MNKDIDLKPIETLYNGYRFRSRLEARWAVFFDSLGIKYEYEPEGFDLGDGTSYLPDFLLHGFEGRIEGDIYVEVKAKITDEDALKIKKFVGFKCDNGLCSVKRPLLILGPIPNGDEIWEITHNTEDIAYEGFNSKYGRVYPFNFESLDGDYFAAHLGINENGKPELFGDDGSYLGARDDEKTLKAYLKAKQARFEFGQNPKVRRVF